MREVIFNITLRDPAVSAATNSIMKARVLMAAADTFTQTQIDVRGVVRGDDDDVTYVYDDVTYDDVAYDVRGVVRGDQVPLPLAHATLDKAGSSDEELIGSGAGLRALTVALSFEVFVSVADIAQMVRC